MGQADASRVRGKWTDSVKDLFLNLGDAGPARSPFSGLHDAAPRLAQSRLIDFLRSEKFLRKVTPTLVIVLLLMVAGARTAADLAASGATRAKAKTTLSHVSSIVSARLNSNPALATSVISPTLAQVFLEDATSSIPGTTQHEFFLLNGQGRITAQRNSDDAFRGMTANRLLGGDTLLQSLGEKAGVRTIFVDGKQKAFATYFGLGAAGEPAVGGLVVLISHDAVFASWYDAVHLDVIMFLVVGTVLLLILYAYYAQGRRTRETELLFVESNARFDTALARGHCGLWDWDLSRGRIVWSRSMYEMLGMEERQCVMGYGELSELMHPDDADMLMLANQVFDSPQHQIDHRFRMMHSSGSWVWMRIRAELVRYKGADPHLIGIAVDITEQEALKQESRNADIRLRDAIENISEAFVLWDTKKRLVMCNSKYQQLYNLPASAVTIGSQYEDVMHQSRKPRIKTQISTDRNKENRSQTFEAQIEGGRWLQISERRTQDGGFVSVGTDITQIKRNEAKLVESERQQMAIIADLRASQRKLELQQQKLVEFADDLSEQKKRADAGNKAKSQFLANISHELRTPLNAIIGFSDIMRSQMFGPLGSGKYDEYANDIHHSGSFLLGVINDVLDMSKIEAGRFELNPETVLLHDLLEETLRIIHIQAKDADITVSSKIPHALELEGDKRAIKQILLNLLSNAVKFTPEGGKINVTARKLKSCVNILIEDNGIGIAESALERLGKPFEQVQDQFSKNHKGSGLGLAIARSLASLHGGTLTIKSVLGEGTTISVKLPFVYDPPKPEEETATDSEPANKAA